MVNELGKDKFEIVNPSVSILAEPPVAVVERTSTSTARAPSPRLPQVPVLARGAGRSSRRITIGRATRRSPAGSPFPKIKLFTIDQVFGGWQKAQATHFADGGIFDQIYQPGS